MINVFNTILTKLFVLLALIWLVPKIGVSQTHQTTSSGGAYLKGQNGAMSITTGQPINQTVRNNNSIATQGFQQPDCNLGASFTEIPPLCANEPAIQLNAFPDGGTFSGTGVTGTTFNPALADTGNHRLKYYVNLKGCEDSAIIFVQVKPIPVVTFSLKDSVCKSAPGITLDQVSPLGGSFNGLGVVNGVFNPSFSGVGNHKVIYSYTNPTTFCSASDSNVIKVKPNPVVSMASLPIVCPDIDSLPLTYGSPVGGTYSGDGVVGNHFIADSASSSLTQLTYQWVDTASQCVGTATGFFIIDSLPTLSASGNPAFCEDISPTYLNTGNPVGGYYEGLGSALDTFGLVNPQQLGPGNYPYNYVFTSSFGCVAKVEDSITILQTPLVQIGTQPSLCIADTLHTFSGGTPTGGVYSGLGLINNSVNLSFASPGIKLIAYSFTDSNNCTATDSGTYIVHTPTPITTVFPQGFCENADSLFLNQYASPFGINFNGLGVSNNTRWSGANLANQHIGLQLLYADTNGCVTEDSVQLVVYPSPSVSLPQLAFCDNQNLIKLSGGLPTGGEFLGNGVDSLGFFNPATIQPTITYQYSDAKGCIGDTSIVPIINIAPTATIEPIPAICSNETSVTLTASPSNGSFSGVGVTSNTLDPTKVADTITQVFYEVTDLNGCKGRDTTQLKVIEPPSLPISLHQTICENEEVVYQLPEQYIYRWDNGDFGYLHTRTVTQSTNLRVSISNGVCEREYLGVITVNSTPTLSITHFSPECETNKGELSVSVSNGTSPFDYQWNSGHQSAFADNLTAGLYEVSVTDNNGCSAIQTTYLKNQAAPSIIANTAPPTCFDATDGQIDVSLPMGFEDYSWYDGSKSLTRGSLPHGDYVIEAQDQNGCKTGELIELEAPERLRASITRTQASCASDGTMLVDVTGGVEPYLYTWNTGENQDLITNKPVGLYSLTITDANNCSLEKQTSLGSSEKFFAQLEGLALPQCSGTLGNIIFDTLSTQYQAQWVGGGTQFNEQVNNGVSTIIISESGCSQVFSFELYFQEVEVPTICAIQTDTTSNQLLVEFEGNGNPYELYRRFNASNAFELIATGGNTGNITFTDTSLTSPARLHAYVLVQEDDCGQSFASDLSSSIWLSGLSSGSSRSLIWAEENSKAINYHLFGETNGVTELIDSVTAKSYLLDSSETFDKYWVVGQTLDSCGINEVFSNVITEFYSSSATLVAENNQKPELFIFPNPARDRAFLSSTLLNDATFRVEVRDSKGKVVFTQIVEHHPSNTFALPINRWAIGHYTVSISLEKQQLSLPLMLN